MIYNLNEIQAEYNEIELKDDLIQFDIFIDEHYRAFLVVSGQQGRAFVYTRLEAILSEIFSTLKIEIPQRGFLNIAETGPIGQSLAFKCKCLFRGKQLLAVGNQDDIFVLLAGELHNSLIELNEQLNRGELNNGI